VSEVERKSYPQDVKDEEWLFVLPYLLSMDVGVDSHEFRPWHFDDIQAIMNIKAEAKAKHMEMRKATSKGNAVTESEDRP
jgi:hypothetical protein